MEPVTAGTVTAGIFLINGIVNGLVNIFNGHKQRSAQDSLSKETMKIQRENMLMQLEQQRRLHRENNQTAIANQLRTYRLSNTWPLRTSPEDIADLAEKWDQIPLCFIVAPIDRKFDSVIVRLRDTMLNEFQDCGPVIQYGYAPNVSVDPPVDINSIYAGLKNLPTLYIAPSLLDNKSLKITIAFWGLGGHEKPATTTMEIDIRKLYVDQLRDDAMDYKTKCDKGYLSWDDKLPSANNFEIFKDEDLKNHGFDWLDNQGFYNKLQACSNTLEKIGDRLLPFMTVFSVALIDMYNVLVRSTTPRLPKYLNQCKDVLPDLRVKHLNSTVNTIKKEEYVESLCCTYVEYIANYASILFLKNEDNRKLITGMLSENCAQRYLSIIDKRKEEKPKKEFTDLFYEKAILLAKRKEWLECVRCAKKAALEGHSEAQNLYEVVVKKCAEADNPEMQYELALLELKKGNLNAALRWAMKSSSQGHADAMDLVSAIQNAVKKSF